MRPLLCKVHGAYMNSKRKKNPYKLLLHNKRQIVEHCDDPVNLESVGRKQKRTKVHDCCTMDVLERAEDLQSSLPPGFPSLIRPMLPSHVTGGFWLGLPSKFCSRHLPKEDATITLEDENRQQYKTRYLWQKFGLSGGWKGFSVAHELVEGDVVVFQLVNPTKFKVHIVRSKRSDEVDGALGLLHLEHFSNKSASDAESNFEANDMLVDKDKTDMPKQSSYNVVSDVLDGRSYAMDFNDHRSIRDFVVVVNGSVIDSEIPKRLKVRYYELCHSQRQCLHENLVKGLNCKLAAGIVSETVNIADAIRASKMATSCENLTKWGRTLSAFKDLGMEVGFLLSRLEKLIKLDNKSRRLKDAKRERSHVEQEKIELEAKLRKATRALRRLDAEIKKMEEKRESVFCKTANAPW